MALWRLRTVAALARIQLYSACEARRGRYTACGEPQPPCAWTQAQIERIGAFIQFPVQRASNSEDNLTESQTETPNGLYMVASTSYLSPHHTG